MCDFHINKPAAAFGSCDLRSTDVADVLSFPVKTHKTLHTRHMAGALPPPHRCPLFCLIAGLHCGGVYTLCWVGIRLTPLQLLPFQEQNTASQEMFRRTTS